MDWILRYIKTYLYFFFFYLIVNVSVVCELGLGDAVPDSGRRCCT